MTNKIIGFGILVTVLVFGMAVIGCDDSSANSGGTDPALNGTWVQIYNIFDTGNPYFVLSDYILKYINGNFEIYYKEILSTKGIYTTNNGKMTMTTTHSSSNAYGIESKLYTKNEMETAFKNKGIPEDIYSSQLNIVFLTITYNYNIEKNTLNFLFNDGPIWYSYTRKN